MTTTAFDDALECECFLTDEYCFCEEDCECGCSDCDCAAWGSPILNEDTEVCACGGNCKCGGIEYEPNEIN